MNAFCFTKPTVMAHRGFSTMFPENTLSAFIEASKFVSHIELDVWLAADGKLVVHHDENLSRTCGVNTLVTSMKSVELASLDAGYTFRPDGENFSFRGRGIGVPRLEDVFVALPQCHFVVEIKDPNPALVPVLLATIQKFKMEERCLVASFLTKVLCDFRKMSPDSLTNLGEEEIRVFLETFQTQTSRYPCLRNRALQIPMKTNGFSLADPKVIEFAHKCQIEVHYWTINDPEDMKKLFSMGADAIMTDNPPLALEVLRGMNLP
jgi:glycerophosphoryl diester phosphodiesterase